MEPTERGSVAPQFSLEVFGPTALKLAENPRSGLDNRRAVKGTESKVS